MRDIVHSYVRKFREERRERRKFLGVLLCLAMAVAGGIMWQFKTTGIAYTNEAQCGIEEHTHSDDCYAWVLTGETGAEETVVLYETQDAEAVAVGTAAAENVVGVSLSTSDSEAAGEAETGSAKDATDAAAVDTSADVSAAESETAAAGETVSAAGTESTAVTTSEETLPAQVLLTEATETEDWYLSHGYEKVLICGKEEHTHTIECLSDETADLETAEVWEATLPTLTGIWANDVIAIAESQIGYAESTLNFTLAEDGATRKGYTRYGAWYGNAYGDWDAMFAAFCLHYAGVLESDFPVNSGAYAWSVSLKEAGLYQSADSCTPAAGDLVFLDKDQDGTVDTVAVITNADDTTLTVVEGNSNDAVEENSYGISDGVVAGYGVLPKQNADSLTGLTKTYTAEAETEDGSVIVTVTAPYGALPDDAVLSVTLYEEDSDEYAAAAETIGYEPETAEVVATEDGIALASEDDTETETVAASGLAVLDICFMVGDEEVEPSEAVTVSIDASAIIPEEADASTIEVQHLTENEDGEVEAVLVADATDETAGTLTVNAGEATAVAEFEVDGFSTFTISWRKENTTASAKTSITCNVYGRNNSNSSYSSIDITEISVILTEGMEYDFINGENATVETENDQTQQKTSYKIDCASVIADGITYTNVQTISYNGSTYTITYTVTNSADDTATYEVEGLSTITSVNLYYTQYSSSGNKELDLSSYKGSAYVWWDTYNGSTTKTGAKSTDDQSHITSVKLNNLDVTNANSDSTSWGTTTTLSSYFPGGSTNTVVYSTLEITPAAGYYVTTVVVACTGMSSKSSKPYNCDTWGDGNAFVTTFSVGTSGTVTVDVSNLDFSHSSASNNYFILICVAPIPSPLYVEYDYGEIVNYIEASTYTNDSSAFSTSTGWTTTSDGNYYGNGYNDTNEDITHTYTDEGTTYTGYGVMTDDTQYKYAYQGNTNATEAARWIHYANTITTDAKEQAAAAGYVFVGWKAEYYTGVTVAKNQDQNTSGYQGDYNNWDYTWSNSYGSTSTYYSENQQVTLTTNVRLIAQWVPIGITVTKEVNGLSETSLSGTAHEYTLEVQKQSYTTDDDGNKTENWITCKTITLSVTVDGSASTVISPLPAGTYRVVETGGNTNLYDGTNFYYIAVDTGKTVSVTYNSEYNVSTVSGENVALLSEGLTVKNSYSETPATVNVALKKVNEDENVLSGAVFTLTNITTNTPITLDATGTDGTVIMSSLTVGSSYTLSEITAPGGYNLLTSSITFSVSSSGVTLAEEYDKDVVSVSDDGLTITVVNTAGTVLPSTGGTGTYLYTLAGLLLVLSAVCLMYKNLRRKGGLPY